MKAVSGDPCPRCGELMQVVNSYVIDATRTRFIGCRDCGYRPDDNKHVEPEPTFRRRLSIRRINFRRAA